jgi:hypothetical protein
VEIGGTKVLGEPGWVEVKLCGDGPPRLLVKVEDRGGRAAITRLVIAGEGLDSSTLRGIPIGRVESLLTPPPTGLMERLPADVLDDMEQRGHLFPTLIRALDQTVNDFLDREPVPVPGIKVTRKPARRKPLTRPDGSDPDAFSRRVADAYSDAIQTTSRPATVLAEEAGVPVGTVHRWVLEARRRGHLPPARKGRAG